MWRCVTFGAQEQRVNGWHPERQSTSYKQKQHDVEPLHGCIKGTLGSQCTERTLHQVARQGTRHAHVADAAAFRHHQPKHIAHKQGCKRYYGSLPAREWRGTSQGGALQCCSGHAGRAVNELRQT